MALFSTCPRLDRPIGIAQKSAYREATRPEPAVTSTPSPPTWVCASDDSMTSNFGPHQQPPPKSGKPLNRRIGKASIRRRPRRRRTECSIPDRTRPPPPIKTRRNRFRHLSCTKRQSQGAGPHSATSCSRRRRQTRPHRWQPTGSGNPAPAQRIIQPPEPPSTHSDQFASSTCLDFKKGVEFKIYARPGLPTQRVIGIESEPGFGRSVLQRLDDAELTTTRRNVP